MIEWLKNLFKINIEINLKETKGYIMTTKLKSITLIYKVKKPFNKGDYIMFYFDNKIIAKVSPNQLGITNKRIKLNLFFIPNNVGRLTYSIARPFTNGNSSKLLIEV